MVAPIGLPQAWPVWSEVLHIVMRPDDGRLAVAAIRLVAWLAWAAFTYAVVIETRAALRNTTARPVHALGLVQRTAATLVGAALLTLAGPTQSPMAVAGPETVAVQLVPDAAGGHAVSLTRPPSAIRSESPPAPAPRAEDRLPVVTVQDGDSLWFLAERHLGAGGRYPEILTLNLGRAQSDGRALTDAHDIEPGWQLRLPADAVDVPDAPAPSATAEPPTRVVVVPGDTLWDLAATHLADGARYPEIVALNLGVRQPDGDALTDPDLIRPGWILTLPSAVEGGQADVAVVEPPTSAPVPDADSGIAGQPDAPPADSVVPEPDAATSAPSPLVISQPDALDHVPDAHADQPDGNGAASDGEPDAAAVPSGLVLGLTSLAAAGLIGELARRRLLQRRVRRTGRQVPRPVPGSPADDAERTWRSTPTPLSLAQLRTALDDLADACFASERDLPRIGAIEVGPQRVVLHLVDEDAHPVAPFMSDGPATWTAPTATLAALTSVDRRDVPEPYPALVALGHTDHSTVLLNLEAAGTLRVVGDAEAAGGVLRAIVAELATSELSGRIGLTAGDEFAALARACAPSRLQAPPPPGAAVQLADRLSGTTRTLHGQGLDDTLQARSDRISPDQWLPVVFVDDVPDAAPCSPWSGSVLITPAPGPGGWTLTVEGSGKARLDALGLPFFAARLEAAGLDLITELLVTATPPPLDAQPLLEPDSYPGARAALGSLPAPRPPAASDPYTGDEPPGLRINVLGVIDIQNIPTGEHLTARQTELLVYLALNGQTTGAAIDEALWPGTRTDGVARWGLAYRARRIVLEANLPRTEKGESLRLGDAVTTDWDDFRRLALGGLDAGPEGLDELRAALALVRGRPLTGIPPDAYAWADRDIDSMINTIADVAQTAARLLLDTGDSRGALSAARAGLSVDPCSDELCDAAVSAALAHGDPDEAARIKARQTEVLAELDGEYA
ncbi:LysM peptidoglycan-binding domain-containing protein [Actinotalea subterranea]|uniref:LysM peptidoglycan-binding domain-containing protein n=1 Tax=Actinotalea subterranea TaxID=2607497 RepID=UPI00165E0D4E|nr:LysM peptidoglycan-binding domain-containing protein [Actinotalea subterranea]